MVKKPFGTIVFACGLIGVIVIVVLYIFMPTVTYNTVHIEDYQENDPYISEAVQMIADAENAVYSTIYLVKTSYICGSDEIVVAIPYICGNVGDVPTAGSAQWNYTVGVQVIVWHGNSRSMGKNALVQDSTISIFADQNTVLYKDESSYCKDIQEEFVVSEKDYTMLYYIERPAITRDSTAGKNEACNNTVCWEGNFSIPHYLRPSISIDFSMETQYPYINNVV